MLVVGKEEEYEHVYYEAREVLYRRGKKLGKPVQGDDNLRRCPVDDALLTDRELLSEAWGVVLSEEVLSEHAHRQALPSGCALCDKLWREYSQATRHYLKLFTDQALAEAKHDAMELARLIPILQQASESRQ